MDRGMAIQFLQCSHCSAPLDPSHATGGMIRCAYCHTVFQVGAPAAPTTVPTSTDTVRAVLQSVPGNAKIPAIKAVREANGMGLKESKELVESVPAVVGDLPPSKADQLKRDVEAFGGEVTFFPRDSQRVT